MKRSRKVNDAGALLLISMIGGIVGGLLGTVLTELSIGIIAGAILGAALGAFFGASDKEITFGLVDGERLWGAYGFPVLKATLGLLLGAVSGAISGAISTLAFGSLLWPIFGVPESAIEKTIGGILGGAWIGAFLLSVGVTPRWLIGTALVGAVIGGVYGPPKVLIVGFFFSPINLSMRYVFSKLGKAPSNE